MMKLLGSQAGRILIVDQRKVENSAEPRGKERRLAGAGGQLAAAQDWGSVSQKEAERFLFGGSYSISGECAGGGP